MTMVLLPEPDGAEKMTTFLFMRIGIVSAKIRISCRKADSFREKLKAFILRLKR